MAQFDDFVSKFNLDDEKISSPEEKLVKQFKNGHNLGASLVFVLSSQGILFLLLFWNFTDPYWKLSDDMTELPTQLMVVCRSVVALFLHIILDIDIRQSLALMKYALNHPWKFQGWY